MRSNRCRMHTARGSWNQHHAPSPANVRSTLPPVAVEVRQDAQALFAVDIRFLAQSGPFPARRPATAKPPPHPAPPAPDIITAHAPPPPARRPLAPPLPPAPAP